MIGRTLVCQSCITGNTCITIAMAGGAVPVSIIYETGRVRLAHACHYDTLLMTNSVGRVFVRYFAWFPAVNRNNEQKGETIQSAKLMLGSAVTRRIVLF